jgi:hypothetical protein
MTAPEILADELIKNFFAALGERPGGDVIISAAALAQKRRRILEVYKSAGETFAAMPDVADVGAVYRHIENKIMDGSLGTFAVTTEKKNNAVSNAYTLHPLLNIVETAARTYRRSFQVSKPDHSEITKAPFDIAQEFGDFFETPPRIAEFFYDHSGEELHLAPVVPSYPHFEEQVNQAAGFEREAGVNAVAKDAILKNPLEIAKCFARHSGPELAQGDNDRWVRSVMLAEAICDKPLQEMTLPELLQVYTGYLKSSPQRAFFESAGNPVDDRVWSSRRKDFYTMGLRELQSSICLRPEVEKRIEYATVTRGLAAIEDFRIAHLVGQAQGNYPSNVLEALTKAVAGDAGDSLALKR